MSKKRKRKSAQARRAARARKARQQPAAATHHIPLSQVHTRVEKAARQQAKTIQRAEDEVREQVLHQDTEGASTGYDALAKSIVNDPILKTVSQPAFALIMLLTLLLFWRGHNLPGGGFVGGAMTICALLLHRIAHRAPTTSFNFTALIPIGLSISFLTGLVPYLFTGYFLKSDYGYVTTRLTGEFEWATAMLFDIGVFLLVVGGGMTIARELIDIDPQEKVERRGVGTPSQTGHNLPPKGEPTWKP